MTRARWSIAALWAAGCSAAAAPPPSARLLAATTAHPISAADAEVQRLESTSCATFCGSYAEEALFAELPVEAPPACLPAEGLRGGTGTLLGTLVDDDGTPLAGHVVVLVEEGGGTLEATTDAAGRFRLDVAPAGQYQLAASAPMGSEALARAWCLRVPAGGALRVDLRVDRRALRRASCKSGQVAPAAGSIVGRVRTDEGALAHVMLVIEGLDHCGRGWGATDAAGDFVVEGLPAGAYDVEIHYGRHVEHREVRITEGAAPLDVVLDAERVRIETAYLAREAACRCPGTVLIP